MEFEKQFDSWVTKYLDDENWKPVLFGYGNDSGNSLSDSKLLE